MRPHASSSYSHSPFVGYPSPVSDADHHPNMAVCKLEPDYAMGNYLDQAPSPTTTVSPHLLKRQPSSAPSSTIGDSGSSLMFQHDDHDLIPTPGTCSDDQSSVHLADEEVWYSQVCHAFPPATLDPAFVPYEMYPPIKCEEDDVDGHDCDDDDCDNDAHASDDSDDSDVSPRAPAVKREPRVPLEYSLANSQYENPKYWCDLCGKTFMRTFNYNAHRDTHNPNRARPFRCEHRGCDKSFFRSTDLRRHELSVHEKCEDFRCSTCGSGFPRKDSLQRHRQSGCAHRAAVHKRNSTGRRASKSSDKAVVATPAPAPAPVAVAPSPVAAPPSPPTKHMRRSSRGSRKQLVKDYMSRFDALHLAGVDAMDSPYFMDRSGRQSS